MRAYRGYLRVHPDAFDIWVQLGNVSKEADHLDEADHAYARALALRPQDADLLLQYGHLRKIQGRPDDARDYYTRSIGLAFSIDALRELNAIVGIDAFGAAMGSSPQQVRAWLQTRSRGLQIDSVNDFSPVGFADAVAFHGNDPWVSFTLDVGTATPPVAGILRFKVHPADGTAPPPTKIYLDYGDGFSEKYLITQQPGTDDPAIFLVNPAAIVSVRWDPAEQPCQIAIQGITFDPLRGSAAVGDAMAGFVKGDASPDRDAFIDALLVAGASTVEDTVDLQFRSPSPFDTAHNYAHWLNQYANPREDDYATMTTMTAGFSVKPRFSIVMPVYNPPIDLLAECIDSVLGQSYPDFEFCIADDCSSNPAVGKLLKKYARDDGRVKLVQRTRNGHISAASNSALALVTGDFVVLVDHDDVLPDFALFMVAYYINQNPGCKILYSDEDKISVSGVRSTPYFKTAFNRFLMYGHNMVSHLGIYDRALIEQVGGFRKGLEGSQDYDLFLRCYEHVDDSQIVHIPHVLYHWRTIPGSTAISADQKGYAVIAAQSAINGHFERTRQPLRSVLGFAAGHTALIPTRELKTSLSIIIPTKDGMDVLRPCIDSILAQPHDGVEILVVDNRSEEKATHRYLKEMSDTGVFKTVAYPSPFNFSSINNFGVAQTTGDIICFLNNDTEVLSANWLDRARALLAVPEVGIVGARLLFPDRTLQHFGIALGMGEDGVAGTVHHGLPEHMPGYFSKAKMTAEFSAVTAACMFIRREVFEEIGGYDTELAVAYNDVDLCLRARRAGYKVIADPEIELIHKESKTRGSDAYGEKRERLRREVAMMHRKWPGTLANDPYYSPNLSLMRSDFALAYPPRVLPPWMQKTGA